MWRIAWLQSGASGPEPDRIRRPGHQEEEADVTTGEDKDLAPVPPEEFEAWYRQQFAPKEE